MSQFEWDLQHAFTDEQACPPEWAEIIVDVRTEMAKLRAFIDDELKCFVNEPDIRIALPRRDRSVVSCRARLEAVHERIARLNLISPLERFQLNPPDTEAIIAPLLTTPRRPVA